jgi:ribonuclease D
LKDYIIIELTNQQEIDNYLKDLSEKGVNAIAVDIECELNLHCYGEHLCLIQIFDGENQVIIDPFNFPKKNSFQALFEKRDLLKIMYDSSSDSLLLQNTHGIRVKSILDLRPAVSLLEYEKQSLSNVLVTELGLAPVNKKKFQMYNWMRRPISREAVEYAMNDVLYLFELKDKLFGRLIENNLLDEFMLRNLMIQPGNKKVSKLTKYEKAKGYSRLSPAGKKLFKSLYMVRDEFARRLNKPPHYVFNNSLLMDLCSKGITDRARIRKGIHHKINPKTRDELLKALVDTIQS